MLQAALYGILAGSSLFIGVLFGLYARIGQRTVASVMAFGSGVLVSALAFDLMEDAYAKGGFSSVSVGFLLGGLAFVVGDYYLDRQGGHARKHAHGKQHVKKGRPAPTDGTGLALLLGAFLDGIPESAALGISILAGQNVGLVLLAAVFLSNLPEGISGANAMKKAGQPSHYILGIWLSTVVIAGVAAALGYQFLGTASEGLKSASLAFAAGAILAMIADTMIPEAFEEGGQFIAMLTVLGFLTAFTLSRIAHVP